MEISKIIRRIACNSTAILNIAWKRICKWYEMRLRIWDNKQRQNECETYEKKKNIKGHFVVRSVNECENSKKREKVWSQYMIRSFQTCDTSAARFDFRISIRRKKSIVSSSTIGESKKSEMLSEFDSLVGALFDGSLK